MESTHTIPLSNVIDQFRLEALYLPDFPENIEVSCARVNRPGLQLVGFYDHYEPIRIQIIGKTENLFVSQMPEQERRSRLEAFFASRPVGLIVTSSIEVIPETLEIAEKYKVPVLRTSERTSEFMAALIAYLNVQLGPRITRHGVLVEVYGEGILILGDSGVGKSETAIELVKRGHRLVADDAVEIKRVSDTTLVGAAPSIIRHFVELRGIGIIDVKMIFGMGAIKESEKIDMWLKADISEELIRKAYDITVDKTGKASFVYASKIVENWISAGYKTLADVEKAEANHKSAMEKSSFDVDDFFKAALERSEKIYGKEVKK